jgi:hypothetical protein
VSAPPRRRQGSRGYALASRRTAAAIAVLVAEFNAYLDRPGADPFADSVSYRQGILWLSPDELDATLTSLRVIVAPLAANIPGPGRRPYLISPIMFPGEEPPAPS